MQNAAFAHHGLSARYERFHVTAEELPEAVLQLKARGCPGWNCTVPHKLAMRDLADELAPSAAVLQSVNTVVNAGGKLTGHCTDGIGWARAVEEAFGVSIRSQRILLLGAGGAGQALARYAVREGVPRLVLVNRTFETAQRLAAELGVMASPWTDEALAAELEQTDLIVNATSVGLKPEDPSVLSPHLLQARHFVYDTIYKSTKLQDVAHAAGARVSGGLGMLIHQGAAAFEIWTGLPAPVEVMRAALG
jgi:shikimate dehydrogenase